MIFAVDRRVKILDDSTKIYVMYAVTRQHYSAYFDYWKESAFTQEWDRDRQDHSAVKKMFRNEFPEIAEWLAAQGARTTYWIDPEIHKNGGKVVPFSLQVQSYVFEYGIGFLPDDPVETAFVLKWM